MPRAKAPVYHPDLSSAIAERFSSHRGKPFSHGVCASSGQKNHRCDIIADHYELRDDAKGL